MVKDWCGQLKIHVTTSICYIICNGIITKLIVLNICKERKQTGKGKQEHLKADEPMSLSCNIL